MKTATDGKKIFAKYVSDKELVILNTQKILKIKQLETTN